MFSSLGPRGLKSGWAVEPGNDHMGVSENKEPKHSTLNNRILIIRTPK